jgi:hypothetical protein
MSARHIERLHTIELPSRERLLLRVLASYACDRCGFASPSLDALVAITGFRLALLQLAIIELLQTEYLRAVELEHQGDTLLGYLVLPELQLELYPAPCESCRLALQAVAREA